MCVTWTPSINYCLFRCCPPNSHYEWENCWKQCFAFISGSLWGSSDDLHFVHLLFLAHRPRACVAQVQCLPPLASTAWTAYRELSQLENRPVSQMYLGGVAEVGKNFILWCAAWGACFSINLNIGVDTSMWSIRSSTPVSLLLYMIFIPHEKRHKWNICSP